MKYHLAIALCATFFGMSAPALAATLPDPRLTPGAIVDGITAQQVCTPGYASSVRSRGYTWSELKNAAYTRYGIPRGQRFGHAIDHAEPIELGGAPDNILNVWPQPYDEAHAKDRMENALHLLVCDGRLSLAEAQRRILEWPSALAGISLTPAEVARLERMTSQDY